MALLRLDLETNEVTIQPLGEVVGEIVAKREDSPRSIHIKIDEAAFFPGGDSPMNMQRASSWHA